MKNKRELIRTKEKSKTFFDSRNLEVFIAVILVIAVAIVSVLLIRKKEMNLPNTAAPQPTKQELYEQYVGPMTCDKQGEWVDLKEFYGLFGEDHKELDLSSALYKQEELKGIIPAGVRLEPVMLSYDDFEPYKDPMENGFLDAYKCSSGVEEIELQLAAPYKDFYLEGSYSTEKNGNVFFGNMAVNITDAEYYMIDSFYPENVGVIEGYGENPESDSLGFLSPHFEFSYDLSGSAGILTSSGGLTDEIKITGAGKLSDGTWQYTIDLVGQKQGVFSNGSIYLRCKLPCNIVKISNGQADESEGFVNLYFKIVEARVGTWIDCLHE